MKDMEGLSVSFVSGLQGFWRGRGYKRLHGSRCRRARRTPEVEEAADAGIPTEQLRRRRRPFWRVRVKPRLRFFRGLSPKKLLTRLRDAYVNMMMSLANSRFVNPGYGGSLGNGFGSYGLPAPALKEYDRKMIVQIYKQMLAEGQLEPRNGEWTGKTTSLASG